MDKSAVSRMQVVALRKESVDRNREFFGIPYSAVMSLSARRAWIEIRCPCRSSWLLASLSARRAWIEITVCTTIITTCIVALRKESVDRNLVAVGFLSTLGGSLSARRAWIEIRIYDMSAAWNRVALRKESVDRNYCCWRPRYTRYVALRKESVDRNSKIAKKVLTSTVALRKESVDRNCYHRDDVSD